MKHERSSLREQQTRKSIRLRDLKLDYQAAVWMGVTSNRELARHIGVSETAVGRAEKAGRIGREADGSWTSRRSRRPLPGGIRQVRATGKCQSQTQRAEASRQAV